MKGITHANCPMQVMAEQMTDAPDSLGEMIGVCRLAACVLAKNPKLQAIVGIEINEVFGPEIASTWQVLMNRHTCCDSEAAFNEAVTIIQKKIKEVVENGA